MAFFFVLYKCTHFILFLFNFRYLATGNSFASLSFSFRLGATTIRSIVRSTCEVLWTVLQPSEMPIPTFEKWKEVADGFFAKWNFPMCIGALDGKHIRLKKPPNTGSQYWNYKGYCSLVLMALVDAHGRFLIIDVGSFGSSSDGGIFKDSTFWKLLQNDKLDVPNPEPIPNTDIVVPYTFVADEAFPLQTNMMRPFPNRDLNDQKRIFNYRLSRARRQVECAFGVMANMWRLLHKAIETNVHSANNSVKAICVLHNFILNKEPDRMSNYEINYQQGNINSHTSCSTARRPSNEAMAVRETFMNYFVSPNGSLPWQRQACYLDENTS